MDIQPSPDCRAYAVSWAANGYFISAFGGKDTDGYVLIGERVQRDTLPRPINDVGVPLVPCPCSFVSPKSQKRGPGAPKGMRSTVRRRPAF